MLVSKQLFTFLKCAVPLVKLNQETLTEGEGSVQLNLLIKLACFVKG